MPRPDTVQRQQLDLEAVFKAIVNLLLSYEYLQFAKAEIIKIQKMTMPDSVKSWMIASLLVPAGIIISTDPLFSQMKEEVYKTLGKMLKS